MKLRKIILLAFNLFFTITCCLTVTYSWFTLNSKVESTNMNFDIQEVSNITTISCYALKYNGVYGASCYSVDSTGTDIAMTEYDEIFTDRNVNTPLIYRVEISNVLTTSNSTISVKIPCVQQYILTTSDNINRNSYTADYNFTSEAYTSLSSFEINKYISNVLRVTIGVGNNSLIPVATTEERVEDNVTIFNEQITALKAVTSTDRSKCFSSVEDNTSANTKTFSKDSQIQLTMNYSDYSSYLFDATASGETETTKHLILYIMFDYDSDLMKEFIATQSGDKEENTLFVNDIGTIAVDNS